MSLIIAYVGKKGCVMVSDKRRIGYFGDKKNLELLESELYSGKIISDDDFKNRADELGIAIKITDDASKVKVIGNTVRGEVSTKGTQKTYRRRIYGTTNGFELLELEGSDIKERHFKNSGIIVLGNEFAKKIAETLISRKWKKSSSSLRSMGELFIEIGQEVSSKTPTVGDKFDLLKQNPNFTETQARRHLDATIDHDVKVLEKFRQQLTEKLVQQSIEIERANKVIDKGPIGRVVSIDGNILYVQLNSNTQAIKRDWKQKVAEPGQNVVMLCDNPDVKIGDEVVIENEDLCLKKNKASLTCDVILCSL